MYVLIDEDSVDSPAHLGLISRARGIAVTLSSIVGTDFDISEEACPGRGKKAVFSCTRCQYVGVRSSYPPDSTPANCQPSGLAKATHFSTVIPLLSTLEPLVKTWELGESTKHVGSRKEPTEGTMPVAVVVALEVVCEVVLLVVEVVVLVVWEWIVVRDPLGLVDPVWEVLVTEKLSETELEVVVLEVVCEVVLLVVEVVLLLLEDEPPPAPPPPAAPPPPELDCSKQVWNGYHGISSG